MFTQSPCGRDGVVYAEIFTMCKANADGPFDTAVAMFEASMQVQPMIKAMYLIG